MPSAEKDATRRVLVTLDVPVENTLADVETDLRHYFGGVVSVEEDTRVIPPDRSAR